MFGRAAECAAIDSLLAAARAGRSGVLVLRGQPGVGKSVLLDYAAEVAAGMRVLRCTGVETELDLAYAGLHQLLRPLAAAVAKLPTGQRGAVQAALGLSPDRASDRFLAATGTLTLLAQAAAREPLLCLVDDAQWLDRRTIEALGFVARRLAADAVAMLVATREAPWPALPERAIGGLDPVAGTSLARTVRAGLTDDDCALLVERTGGNPLALVELANGFVADQVDPRPLPLTEQLARLFSAPVDPLPAEARRMLLLSAADTTAELSVIGRAAAILNLPLTGWDEARRAGLVAVEGGVVTFPHPLIRAAIYHHADTSERLTVHRALADAMDGQVGRRAWHLAAATIWPNENVAAELEHSGQRARQRARHTEASTAFARAAALSADARHHGRRLTLAALAAHDGGDFQHARDYARQADTLVDDSRSRADITHVLARIELVCGSAATALPLFLQAAALAAGQAPVQAALMLSEATWAAETTGEVRKFAEVVAKLTALPLPADHSCQSLVMAHVGLGEYYTGQKEAGTARLRQSLDALVADADSGRHVRLAMMPVAGMVFVTGDPGAGTALGRASVAHCRARGLIGQLPLELAMLGYYEMLAEHHLSAKAHASEAMRLATDLGQRHVVCISRVILSVLGAAQGDEASRDLIAEALRTADSSHFGVVNCLASWPLGLLELSLGRPVRALEQLTEIRRHRGTDSWPCADIFTVPDLVEAAARAGTPGEATEALERFERWVHHSQQPWAQAVLHRSHALLNVDDDAVEHHYRTAVRLHDDAGPHDRPFARARTHLLFGEWLRRKRRRTDARPHLLAAHETFSRLDATAWAARAESELRATGQPLRRSHSNTTSPLTPQELQVIRLAAGGGSNRDIAAALFLSPRTVGYHLSKAFRKLGIVSRHELARLNIDRFDINVACLSDSG